MKKYLSFFVFVSFFMTLLFITVIDAKAATTTNITLFKSDSWSYVMNSDTNYIGTSTGANKGKKYAKPYATASISGKTFTITATAASGTNTFYIYKKSGSLERTVTVAVKELPANLKITNKYQDSGTIKSNNIYLYSGQNSTATLEFSGYKDSIKWSFSSTGITLGSVSSVTTSINAITPGTYNLTATLTAKSNGKKYGTITKTTTTKVYVYAMPTIDVYANGKNVSSITIDNVSNVLLSQKTSNLPANVRCSYSAYVNDNSSSYIKLLSDTASGYYTLSAKSAFMSGITAYFTYQLTITSGDNVSNNNGTQTIKKIISVHMGTIYSKAENIYFANTTLTSLKNKTFNVQPIILPVANTKKGVTWTSSNPDVATVDSSGNVHTLKIGTTTISAKTTDQTNLSASYKLNVVPDAPAAPSLSESTTGIQLTWRSIAGIVSYEIYRAETSNGEYTKIATVNSTSYIDKPAYGKTYYYKLTAIPSLGSTYTSSFGNAKSLKHMPATPSIKKIKKKSKKIISISIRGNTYDGFVIYMGRKKNTKNAVNIIKGKNCSLSVKRKRSYYIRVRAYVIQDGKKIYSRYSTAVKYKNK